ncbi:MAG: hypothetical protein ACYTFW_19875 [Planctomycetota bacterium]
MKTKNYYLILAVFVGISSIPSLGWTESLLQEDKPFLVGRPYPALAGIDRLRVVIMRPGAELNKDGLVWTELEAKVIDKFNTAGVKVIPGISGNALNIQELRIYINMLKPDDSQQYVFRIQTSAVLVKDMPAKVTNVVLEQVEVFISARAAANPPGSQTSDVKTDETDSSTVTKKQAGPNGKSAVAEYKYIASKNSNIFHNLQCTWAKKIKPENLVGYKNKDEAIKAGKRACKLCNP